MNPFDRRRRQLVGTLAGVLAASGAGVAVGQVRPGQSPARGGAPTAAAAPATPPDYQPNQKVEAREGDTWSPATVLKREGRRIQIKYDDGTEEWVTADRLRPTGAAGAGSPAGAGAAAGGAATRKGGAAAAKPAAKEQYAIGAKVEAKEAISWKPATIKNRDADLYLVIFQGWESQFHWKWVHVSMVRNVGDAKPGPNWANAVGVGNNGVAAAKAEAQKKFANIEKELAAERAKDEAAGRGERVDPFAPKPYDKPITPPVLAGIKEKAVGAAPAKVPPEPIDPAVARLAGRPVVLKGGPGGQPHHAPELYYAGTFALAVYADQFAADVKSLQAERINLATGVSDGAVDWDLLSVPLAISPSGRRVLARIPGFHGGTKNRVDLWDLPASAGGAAPTPKHLVSFRPYPDRDNGSRDVDWAALTDDEHALTCSNKGELIYWKVGPASATGIWRTTVNGSAQLTLSPGGKRVACQTSAGLAVLDVATGDAVALVDAARSPSATAFSPDGKQVVGVSGATLSHWDLEKGTFAGDIGLPPAVNARSVVFANDGFVLLGGQHLLDLARKVVVWRYDGAGGAVASHAGRIWTTVADGPRRVLTSAELPQEKVKKAAAALGPGLDPGSMLLRPGATVTLEVAIEGTEEQRKGAVDAITAQLKRNQITVADGQPVKVVARTENGKTTEMTYQSHGGFGPRAGGPFREVEKTSVTEKITRVYVEANGKVAWENRTVSVPFLVTRKQGQSIGEAVAAANTFNLAFLQSVRVPGYVPRPQEPLEQGKSTWATSGVRDER